MNIQSKFTVGKLIIIYIYMWIYIYIYNMYLKCLYMHFGKAQYLVLWAVWWHQTSVVLYSLTRATLKSPGKDETRVCGFIYIYIYIYNIWRLSFKTRLQDLVFVPYNVHQNCITKSLIGQIVFYSVERGKTPLLSLNELVWKVISNNYSP